MTNDSALAVLNKDETAISMSAQSAAAMARAQVEARFVVALKRPRDVDEARTRLLKDCKRPRFADSAIYSIPRGGKKIEGASIRLAESALRAFTNYDISSTVIHDDDERRVKRVNVTDLESNLTYEREITVRKVVERRNPQKGATVISQRVNSYGKAVYLVRATDDEIADKEGALESKALRTLALRHIPQDVLDDALDQCRRTQQDRAAKDPDSERKALADGFAELNVTPSMLAKYLGHPLDSVSPAELVELRQLWMALTDGAVTWAEVMESRTGDEDGDPAASGAEKIKRDLEKRRAAKATNGEPATPENKPGRPAAVEPTEIIPPAGRATTSAEPAPSASPAGATSSVPEPDPSTAAPGAQSAGDAQPPTKGEWISRKATKPAICVGCGGEIRSGVEHLERQESKREPGPGPDGKGRGRVKKHTGCPDVDPRAGAAQQDTPAEAPTSGPPAQSSSAGADLGFGEGGAADDHGDAYEGEPIGKALADAFTLAAAALDAPNAITDLIAAPADALLDEPELAQLEKIATDRLRRGQNGVTLLWARETSRDLSTGRDFPTIQEAAEFLVAIHNALRS